MGVYVLRIEQLTAFFATGQLGRFVFVGGINTVVGLGGFPLLYYSFGDMIGYFPILVFCSVFNPIFSFVTHKFVTFEKHVLVWSELRRYGLLCGASFLASWGFLAMIDGWRRPWFLAAQCGFNLVLIATSFLVNRYFVYAPEHPPT